MNKILKNLIEFYDPHSLVPEAYTTIKSFLSVSDLRTKPVINANEVIKQISIKETTKSFEDYLSRYAQCPAHGAQENVVALNDAPLTTRKDCLMIPFYAPIAIFSLFIVLYFVRLSIRNYSNRQVYEETKVVYDSLCDKFTEATETELEIGRNLLLQIEPIPVLMKDSSTQTEVEMVDKQTQITKQNRNLNYEAYPIF